MDGKRVQGMWRDAHERWPRPMVICRPRPSQRTLNGRGPVGRPEEQDCEREGLHDPAKDMMVWDDYVLMGWGASTQRDGNFSGEGVYRSWAGDDASMRGAGADLQSILPWLPRVRSV